MFYFIYFKGFLPAFLEYKRSGNVNCKLPDSRAYVMRANILDIHDAYISFV